MAPNKVASALRSRLQALARLRAHADVTDEKIQAATLTALEKVRSDAEKFRSRVQLDPRAEEGYLDAIRARGLLERGLK